MAEEAADPIKAPLSHRRRDAAWLIEYLRQARLTRAQDSEAVAEYGEQLLDRHASSLSQIEVWTVREQVAIAALRCGRNALALRVAREVHKRFKTSARASRLAGMLAEAAGDGDAASSLYDRELVADPGNVTMLKRKVALARAAGDPVFATSILLQHLKSTPADSQSWEELAEIYLGTNNLTAAVFALEEALMLNPGNADLLLLLADILFTIGSAHSLRAARANYALVIELTGGRSTRARYGAIAASAALSAKSEGGKKGGSRDAAAAASDDGGLTEAAAESLLAEYGRRNPEKAPLVRALVKAQGVKA